MFKAFVVLFYFWQGPAGSGEPKTILGPTFASKQDCEQFRAVAIQTATNAEGKKQAEKERIDLSTFEVKCVEFGK